MSRESVSKKVLAVGAVSLLAAGCGASVNEENAPAQVRQAVTSAVTPVAAGRYHSLAVRSSDGTVWAWGADNYGQLGNGTVDNYPHLTPTQVQGLSGTFTSVAAGEISSLALRSDGTVWGWGRNGTGELGDNTTAQRTTAVQVRKQTTDGSTAYLSNVVAISSDSMGHHALALLSDGNVWAWGYNRYGQAGDGTDFNNRLLPVRVQTVDASLPYLTDVVAIATGMHHSLAVRSDGSVWAWGRNDVGQLGDGTKTDRTKAGRVAGLPTSSVLTGQPVTAVDVAAGMSFSLVLLSDGTVYSFGNNGADGTLGYGSVNTSTGSITPNTSTSPVRVGNLTGITRIEGCKLNGMAVDGSGVIWTWGSTWAGALGNGSDSGYPVLNPVSASVSAVGRNVACGEGSAIAMDTGDAVWTWGPNQYGQLGRVTPLSGSGQYTHSKYPNYVTSAFP